MSFEWKLIATATFGLEAVVARELEALGYDARVSRPGWLSFAGSPDAVARANLFLRASDRVLVELATFTATDFGSLFDQASSVAWEELLPRNASFPVRGRSVRSRLASVPACQRIVKKAVVERLKKAHRVGSLPEDGPSYPIEVAILKDEVTLAVDTTGAGLHKRGYRSLPGEAPLKETLAAGLVLLSVWRRERPFLDPFCGTGTLAIEAALIARRRAPGLARAFVAESWPVIGEETFRRAREEARDGESPPLAGSIVASDADEAVVARAKACAERAGVREDIRFEVRPFSEISDDRAHGCLITNPPYGGRMGDEKEVRALYRSMPSVLRRFPTWSIYVLTSRRDFENLVGQKARHRRKLYNGRIECTYYQFLGPRPGGEDAPEPVFGGLSEKAYYQADIFANRLNKRARHLRRWRERRGTDCYRLYESDIKEVPLVVDRYADCLVLTRPPTPVRSRTPAEHAEWLELMVEAAAKTLGLSPENVFLEGGDHPARTVEVRENGLGFEVHLGAKGDTGLYPGYREVRRELTKIARGRDVLSLFSHAGSFGIAAAASGARSTTLVDPLEENLSWARRNYQKNGLSGSEHRFLCLEPERFLKRDRGRYQLAVVDWPRKLPDVEWILQGVHPLIESQGVVYVVTRRRRSRLSTELSSVWTTDDVTAPLLPEEFRSTKSHRVWRLHNLGEAC